MVNIVGQLEVMIIHIVSIKGITGIEVLVAVLVGLEGASLHLLELSGKKILNNAQHMLVPEYIVVDLLLVVL